MQFWSSGLRAAPGRTVKVWSLFDSVKARLANPHAVIFVVERSVAY